MTNSLGTSRGWNPEPITSIVKLCVGVARVAKYHDYTMVTVRLPMVSGDDTWLRQDLRCCRILWGEPLYVAWGDIDDVWRYRRVRYPRDSEEAIRVDLEHADSILQGCLDKVKATKEPEKPKSFKTVELPRGGKAILSYLPPLPHPDTGYEWPDSLDYEGVRLDILLPATGGFNYVSDEFLGSSTTIAKDLLRPQWGVVCRKWLGQDPGDTTVYRSAHLDFRDATLAEAEHCAEMEMLRIIEALKDILNRRALRLIKRDEHLANSRANHGEIVPE